MQENNNQIPILRFLNKHKWRIILPVLFIMFYISIPQVLSDRTAVQQTLFIKSATLSKTELMEVANSSINYVKNDEFLKGLILKYDLYISDQNNLQTQIEKLRKEIDIRPENENLELEEGVRVYVWTHFRDNANAAYIVQISKDVASQFEQNQSLHIDKYVTKPFNSGGNNKYFQFVANIFVSMLMFSFPLILLWEIPQIFYSPKTKQMVFEPLKADWQDELLEAKLRGETWKVFQINIRYSYAFIAAMCQKSPLGDLVEFFSKFAK